MTGAIQLALDRPALVGGRVVVRVVLQGAVDAAPDAAALLERRVQDAGTQIGICLQFRHEVQLLAGARQGLVEIGRELDLDTVGDEAYEGAQRRAHRARLHLRRGRRESRNLRLRCVGPTGADRGLESVQSLTDLCQVLEAGRRNEGAARELEVRVLHGAKRIVECDRAELKASDRVKLGAGNVCCHADHKTDHRVTRNRADCGLVICPVSGGRRAQYTRLVPAKTSAPAPLPRGPVRRAVQIELARLLVGVHERSEDTKRRPSRRPAEYTTEYGCATINRLFRSAAGSDASWSDAETWALLRERWSRDSEERPEVLAARHLLYMNADGRFPPKAVVREAAVRALGRGVSEPNSIRMIGGPGDQDDFESDVLRAIIPVLIGDIEDALARVSLDPSPVRIPDIRPAAGTPLQPASSLLAKQLAERLDVHAPPYPPHLPPSVLAAPLTVSRWAPRTRGVADEEWESSEGGRALRKVLKHHDRVVVLGAPGGGKSTTLVGEVVRRAQEGNPALLVRLPELARALVVGGVPADLDGALRLLVEIAAAGEPLALDEHATTLVQALGEADDGLLALDGLDEIEPAETSRVRSFLSLLSGLRASVVVSSRFVGYVAPPGKWHEVSVDALSRGYAKKFFEEWFIGRAKRERSRALRALRHHELRDMAASPVLLGIIATVAERESLPATRGALYDRYIACLLERGWRPPEGRRTSAADVFARRRAAMELAWSMATGGTGIVDEGRWSESTSLAEALDAAAVGDAADLQELLEGDALLVPYGRSESRFHQQFMWSHRTLQEHLVGAALAYQKRHDPSAWQEQFLRMILGPDRWREPLRHMLQVMTEPAQMTVLSHLRDLAEVPSIEPLVGDCAFDLCPSLPHGVPARLEAAEWAISQGQWIAARELDLGMWKTRFPEALLAGEIVPTDCWDLSSAVRNDAGWLLDLADKYLSTPHRDDDVYVALIEEAGLWEPNEALRRYVSALERGVAVELVADGWHKRDPSEAAIRDVLTRGSALDPRSRLLLLKSLLRSEVQSLALEVARQVADPLDVLVATDLNDYSRGTLPTTDLDEQARGALQCVAREHYGEHPAFELGYAPDFAAFPLTDEMPAAQVGAATRELWATWPAEEDHVRAEPEIELLLTFTADDASRLPQVLVLLRAATACMRSATTIEDETALDLYRHVLAVENELEGSRFSGTVAHEAIKYLRDAMLHLVHESPIDVVIKELQRISPETWPSDANDPGSLDLAALLGLKNRWPGGQRVDLGQLIDAIQWGAGGGRSVASCIHGDLFEADTETIADALDQRAPDALTLPGNLSWLTHALRVRGALYRRRESMLGITATAPGRNG